MSEETPPRDWTDNLPKLRYLAPLHPIDQAADDTEGPLPSLDWDTIADQETQA